MWPIQVTWAARGRGGGQGSLLGAGARGWGWGRAAPSFSEPSPAHPWAHGPTVARATPGRRRRGGGRGARSPGRWGRSGRRRRGTPRGSSPRRSPARRPGRRRPNLERGAAREPRRPGQQDGGPERGVCPEAFPRGAAAGPARPQALGRAGRCRQRLAAGLLGQGHGRGRTRGGGGVTPGRPQGPSHAANTCEKGQPELRRLPCLKGTLAGSQPSLAHRVLGHGRWRRASPPATSTCPGHPFSSQVTTASTRGQADTRRQQQDPVGGPTSQASTSSSV